jgi:hypothetical protein
MTTAWIKDRALLILLGLFGSLFAWSYFHVLGEAAIPLIVAAIIVPEIVDCFRLRKRMTQFAAAPAELMSVSEEFRRLVVAGERKKAIALYRDAFALSTFEAMRAIAATENA